MLRVNYTGFQHLVDSGAHGLGILQPSKETEVGKSWMQAGACSFRLALCSGSPMSGKAWKGEWVLARQWGEGIGRPLVEGWLSSCFRETWELWLRAVTASACTHINPDSWAPPAGAGSWGQEGPAGAEGHFFFPHLSGSFFSVSRLFTNVYTFLLDTTYQSKIRTQFLKKSYTKK